MNFQLPGIELKIVLAYWPSLWQAVTSDETVVDLIFGVFSSRAKAIEIVSTSIRKDEWEEYKDQFVYEELELDEYHPIPNLE